MELLTAGTFVPKSESNVELRKSHVTFALGNESSRGRKFRGTKVPRMKLSFQLPFNMLNYPPPHEIQSTADTKTPIIRQELLRSTCKQRSYLMSHCSNFHEICDIGELVANKCAKNRRGTNLLLAGQH